ncbi:hypothetical protein PUN4_230105 [Paraburkholderia unamae]|uniref:hypothetical protein n=1 Tax=Paraburkholderia unamae TaxID=219649 RepID=UPI001CAAFAD5|nr:hypothetical protein [Paraburkholderia unamae]CAG9255109.1 hypothetical protein PUN4_230105 [Paraburkholderia unamae]
MVIATAEAFHDAGLNYQQAMHATCIDIDPCCVHMAYLQLSLLHIPAIIVHGNALTQEVWGHWFTPAHVLGGWSARLRSRRAIDAMRALVSGNDQEPASSAVVDIDSTVDLIEPSRGADREGVVALASPPVAAHDVIDLFEDALGVARPNPDIFEKVDQLVLF